MIQVATLGRARAGGVLTGNHVSGAAISHEYSCLSWTSHESVIQSGDIRVFSVEEQIAVNENCRQPALSDFLKDVDKFRISAELGQVLIKGVNRAGKFVSIHFPQGDQLFLKTDQLGLDNHIRAAGAGEPGDENFDVPGHNVLVEYRSLVASGPGA
jgi:hypothetical protein